MHKFLVTLHVLTAIFIIGPLVAAPMTALRAVRHRDASVLRDHTRQTLFYGLGSLAVFLFGLAIIPTSSRYDFGSTWITISMTLYIIAIVLILAVLVPTMRRIGAILGSGVLGPDAAAGRATPVATEPAGETAGTTAQPADGTAGEPTSVTATGADFAAKARLDSAYGRIAMVSGLVSLLFVVIAIFMVVKPFS